VLCRWHQRKMIALLQVHEERWRVYRPFRLAPKDAQELDEPRGNLLPLAGFDGPNDLGHPNGVTLHCRPDCRRPVRWVALRRLYELADAARAAGKSKTVLD
jgi:hypothetical protein